MSEFVYFQIYEHIALHKPVVKDQVNIEVFLIEGKSFLTCFEKESFAQLDTVSKVRRDR